MSNHVDFLRTASPSATGDFELARLNEAANLRKMLHQVIDKLGIAVEQLVEAEAQAKLAHYVRELKLDRLSGSTIEVTQQ